MIGSKTLVFLILVFNENILKGASQGSAEVWKSPWFPHAPNEIDNNPYVELPSHEQHDKNHRIAMGIKDKNCDDAKTKLEIDWFLNPENYTCFADKKLFKPSSGVHPLHTVDYIPLEYSAWHACMDEPIYYDKLIPTFGVHRPLWAKYGEYKFVPKQRWVHNLEHGAVVMLYHPCADKNQVNLLRKLVKSCLYKHVITPYNLLSTKRPLALVTWGHRLEISRVSPKVVINFIREHALQAPESVSRDGQYDLLLETHAEVVSDLNDATLCPGSQITMK